MVVSEGLEGATQSVTVAFEWETGPGARVPGYPGTFLFSPRPPDLSGYAWHQLAMAIVNRAPMRSCEKSGRTFPVRDRRQRFCAPTCASRARYRRWSSKRQPDNREEE
jgi:hypothetical protein